MHFIRIYSITRHPLLAIILSEYFHAAGKTSNKKKISTMGITMDGSEGVSNCIDENKPLKADPIPIIIAMIAITTNLPSIINPLNIPDFD